LDKKLITDSEQIDKTEQIKAECTYRDGYERVSKRKASTLIANLNRDSSSEDEDDNRYDFAHVKKKITRSNKSNNVECAENQHIHSSNKKAMLNIAGHSFSDDNSDIDNECVKHLGFKKRTDEKDERISPELTAYPRRITPPNPKTRLSLIRQRRGNTTSKPSPKTRRTNENKAEQTRNQKKNNTMTEEEIRRKLEENWNDEEKVAVKKDMEIRPLPISREIRSKLREKRLPFSKTAKETRKEEESDEERNKKKRLKFCEQRKKEELCRIENRNGNWEHQLLSDDENKSPEMNQVSY